MRNSTSISQTLKTESRHDTVVTDGIGGCHDDNLPASRATSDEKLAAWQLSFL